MSPACLKILPMNNSFTNELTGGARLARFGLAWFNGISTIVGYSMPNPLYTYILNI